MTTATTATPTAATEDWTFVVDRKVQFSFRRKPFLVGHTTSGTVAVGDWFLCPSGILGQVVKVDSSPLLSEADPSIVVAIDREGVRQGDVLTHYPIPA